MSKALLCPNCKSSMMLPSKKKDIGRSVDAFCKTCWKDVTAAIVQDGKKAKPARLPSLSAAIFYSIGNIVEITKFNFTRLLVYLIIFLQFGGNTALCLCNPYIVILLSTLFLVLLHMIISFMPQFISSAALKRIYTAKVFVFGVLPLVAVELFLASVNFLFVIIDFAIALALLVSIKKRR